jgi:hypothetical protein
LLDDPAAAVVGGAFYVRYESGEVTRYDPPTDFDQIRQTMSVQGCFCHSAVVYRADVVQALGGFDTERRNRIDHDLWLRIGAAGHELRNVAAPVVIHYRSTSTYFGRELVGTRRVRSALGMLELNLRACREFDLGLRSRLKAVGRVPVSLAPQRARTVLNRREVELSPEERRRVMDLYPLP